MTEVYEAWELAHKSKSPSSRLLFEPPSLIQV